MLVRFLKSWRRGKPGDTTVIPDGAANVLIRRGIVERDDAMLTPEDAGAETAMLEHSRRRTPQPKRR